MRCITYSGLAKGDSQRCTMALHQHILGSPKWLSFSLPKSSPRIPFISIAEINGLFVAWLVAEEASPEIHVIARLVGALRVAASEVVVV